MIRKWPIYLTMLAFLSSCGAEGLTNVNEPLIAAPVADVVCTQIVGCPKQGANRETCDHEVQLKGKLVITEIPPGSSLAQLFAFTGSQVCKVSAECEHISGGTWVTCEIHEFELQLD